MSEYAQIRQDEGFRNRVYRDGDKLAVGYGHNLVGKDANRYKLGDTIPTDQLEEIYKKDYNKARSFAQTYAPKNSPPEVTNILTNMGFQMGPTGVRGFQKMGDALNKGDYKTAAAEMRNSKWYTQTPERAERLARRMESIGMAENDKDKNKKVAEGALSLGLPDEELYKKLPTRVNNDKDKNWLEETIDRGSDAVSGFIDRAKPVVEKAGDYALDQIDTFNRTIMDSPFYAPMKYAQEHFYGPASEAIERGGKKAAVGAYNIAAGNKDWSGDYTEQGLANLTPLDRALVEDTTGEAKVYLDKYNSAMAAKEHDSMLNYVDTMREGHLGRDAAWQYYQDNRKNLPEDVRAKVEADFKAWKDEESSSSGPVQDPENDLLKYDVMRRLKGETGPTGQDGSPKTPEQVFKEKIQEGAINAPEAAGKDLFDRFNTLEPWYASDSFRSSIIRFGLGIASGESLAQAYDKASVVYDENRGAAQRRLLIEDLRQDGYTEESIQQWIKTNNTNDLSMGQGQFTQSVDQAGNVWEVNNETGKETLLQAAPKPESSNVIAGAGGARYGFKTRTELGQDESIRVARINQAISHSLDLPKLATQIPASLKGKESDVGKVWEQILAKSAMQPGSGIMELIATYDLTDDPDLKAYYSTAASALDPLLRIASGAVVTDPETKSAIARNIPLPSDPASLSKTKIKNLGTVLLNYAAILPDESGAKYNLMNDVYKKTQQYGWTPVLKGEGIELYDPANKKFYSADDLVEQFRK